jgi:hypothetical protein
MTALILLVIGSLAAVICLGWLVCAFLEWDNKEQPDNER